VIICVEAAQHHTLVSCGCRVTALLAAMGSGVQQPCKKTINGNVKNKKIVFFITFNLKMKLTLLADFRLAPLFYLIVI
jgi:hypothetical protein